MTARDLAKIGVGVAIAVPVVAAGVTAAVVATLVERTARRWDDVFGPLPSGRLVETVRPAAPPMDWTATATAIVGPYYPPNVHVRHTR